MIHEEIVTFEVAKLAKEKGFGEMVSCYQGYRKDGTLFYFSNMPDGRERIMQTDCLAPTQSLLQRWLLEEKKYAISVFWDMLSKAYYYEIVKTLGVLEIPVEEKSNYFSPKGFDTYEFALEDALKYTLENLVKTCGKH